MDSATYVGVIGAGECTDLTYKTAQNLGFEIGKRGWILVCGGLGGVMEAAAKGCVEAGGMTLGILPGSKRNSANPYIRIALPTGLGEGRNLLVVRASDVLVAISGGYGTLSEIALALKAGKPVIGLETWEHIQGIQYVSTPDEVIEKIMKFD
ncbi:MAG: TIGR00725 family protein [Deltaproteobacteria bacterium]|nr:TIGR00725 family protein [Deltaproteobacteria bacterium]